MLPGLDQRLETAAWEGLDPGHPQFGLHQLLQTMKVDREDVTPWFAAPTNSAREALLSETLRPAPTTDAWRTLAQTGARDITDGLNGMALAACADPAQEALTIALALRQALETPGRTAALVTPDRNLARRVAAEMARWHVTIDDSAGRPLAHTACGAFLCLLADAVAARFAPVPLLALLKHPFARRGQDGASFRAWARALDRWCLRGPRPDAGLAGIARAIAMAASARHPPPGLAALADWWRGIAAILMPLEQLGTHRPLAELIDAHVVAAERLACDESDDCILWRGEDGEKANGFIKELMPAASGLAPVECASWPPLLRALLMKQKVRLAFGQHPRLAILGALEARLLQFDLTILAG